MLLTEEIKQRKKNKINENVKIRKLTFLCKQNLNRNEKQICVDNFRYKLT